MAGGNGEFFRASALIKPKIKQPKTFTEKVPKGKFIKRGFSSLESPYLEIPPKALPIAIQAMFVIILFTA